MYCIEGEITTRERPETLIGKYGFHYTDTLYGTERTFKSTGSLEFVEETREQWALEEGIGPDTPIEFIGDSEAAAKYTPHEKDDVGLECDVEPNTLQVVTARIPSERELLLANVALWHESRKPFSRRYTLARGNLLALFNFEAEQGWFVPHDSVQGTRQVTGRATPRKHDIQVVTRIEARDKTPGSYYPEVTVIEQTRKSRSDRARFLNISRDLKQGK